MRMGGTVGKNVFNYIRQNDVQKCDSGRNVYVNVYDFVWGFKKL